MPIVYNDDDAGGSDTYTDPDELFEAPAGEAKPGSLLAKITRSAQEFVSKPTRLSVPSVAGLFVEYSTALDTRTMNRLRVAADKHPDKPLRPFRFNLLLLAQFCTGMYADGEAVLDSTGEPVTFRTREFWEQFGTGDDGEPVVRDAAGAVSALYRRDFDVVATVNALMADAGMDEEPGRADPTSGD